MGHMLDTGIRCFRATRVGNKANLQRQDLAAEALKTPILPKGALLDHKDGGTKQMFSPRAVQQLKLLPKVNTSHFLRPRVDVSLYFNGPKANK